MIQSNEIEKQPVFRDTMIGLESSLCNNCEGTYQFQYKRAGRGWFNK